ncbi:MAG TPA: c-type cytochrome [Gemmatimonadaceae bacterium]|nr:c-type cytochrome [Gemmatimonadaceae bacterium]
MHRCVTRCALVLRATVAVAVVAAIVACPGAPERAEPTDTAAATPPPTGALPPGVTPQMVALGDSIFHGRVANGICFTCHGQNGEGNPALGPNLRDGQWLHGDGSLEFIRNNIRTGVATPIQFPTVMLPMGGTSLTEEQLGAVAAYVYSLNPRPGG